MSPNDLDAPLAFPPDADTSRSALIRDIPWGGLALSGMGLIAASLVAFVAVTDTSKIERPPAIASLEAFPPKRISVPDLPPAPAVARSEEAVPAIGRTIRTTTQTHYERGLLPATRSADASATIVARAREETTTSLTPAPDPRLVEHGPHGELPRIGRDGSRPADVYARPPDPRSAALTGAPRVSIVVTGMGLDRGATERAIATLPPATTLAFMPYGADVEDQASQARDSGHEILLQAEMEDFESPRAFAAASRGGALDTLHWQMSRFSGYVGLTNLHAGRGGAARAALEPVMQEIAGRGLVFLGDASSAHSALALATGAPAARADVAIDALQEPAAVDVALRRLELLARERGAAIGVVAGEPRSVDRVSRFAQGLEARGVLLAPLSALIHAPARTSAR